MATVSLDDVLAAIEGVRRDLQAQIDRLASAVEALAERGTEAPDEEEISPETLVVLAAAATAFLGSTVRLQSARLVPDSEAVSRWTLSGRAGIHASHNLRRGRWSSRQEVRR